MCKLLYEFAAQYGSDNNDKGTQHHDITGGKLSISNDEECSENGDPFVKAEDVDEIYNLLID